MSKIIKSIIMNMYREYKESELNGRYSPYCAYKIIELASVITNTPIKNKEQKNLLFKKYLYSLKTNNKKEIKIYREQLDREISQDLKILNKYLEQTATINDEEENNRPIWRVGRVGCLSYEDS